MVVQFVVLHKFVLLQWLIDRFRGGVGIDGGRGRGHRVAGGGGGHGGRSIGGGGQIGVCGHICQFDLRKITSKAKRKKTD